MFVNRPELAFATLVPRLRTHAASLLNLSRNIGGSIGISVVAALLARNLQVAHADMAGAISDQVLPSISGTVVSQLGLPAEAAIALADAEINRQAAFILHRDLTNDVVHVWHRSLVRLLRPVKREHLGNAHTLVIAEHFTFWRPMPPGQDRARAPGAVVAAELSSTMAPRLRHVDHSSARSPVTGAPPS